MPSMEYLTCHKEQRWHRKFKSAFLNSNVEVATTRTRTELAHEPLSPALNTFPPDQFLPFFYGCFCPFAMVPPLGPELSIVMSGGDGPRIRRKSMAETPRARDGCGSPR